MGFVEQPRQWAAATFLSGLLAMLCLLYGSGMFPTFPYSPLEALTFLAIYVGLIPWATTIRLILAGAVFGLVAGLAQIAVFQTLRKQAVAWIGICVVAGVASFGWLRPLHWRLYDMVIHEFGGGLPQLLFSGLLLVTPAISLFMLGWLIYSLVTGVFLKFVIDRQARIDGTSVAAAFD